MLKFEDFQPVDKGICQFKFQKLSFINSTSNAQPVYCDASENKYSFVDFDTIQELRTIDTLARTGVILNYRGALQKEGKLFGFYSIDQYQNLNQYGQKLIEKTERPDERFCIEFFQSFILILLQVQKQGQYLKILSPFMIGLRSPESQTNLGFGLLLPFPCKFLNCILKQQYELNIKFVAPEIIRYFNNNQSQEVCQKQFRKACLYSLGLTLLMCFGYTFTIKQRIEASRNDKQFRNTFKKIRREIKVLHNGKFVSKALKLLLEDCEKSRQIIETFFIKLKSAQFDNLKICKNANINEYKFFSTISDSNKSHIAKSQKTINMEINENTSPFNLTPISNLGHSQKSRFEENANSPINIEISYGDQAPQSIWLSKVKKERIVDEQIMEKFQSEPETKQKKEEEQKIEEKKLKIIEEVEVYQYNDANQIKIGGNKERNIELKQDSTLFDQAQIRDEEFFDQKSILRRKFQNESKVIMALILLSFFFYGVAGYIRQNS